MIFKNDLSNVLTKNVRVISMSEYKSNTLPCIITGMAYIPHSVLRKLDVGEGKKKHIQKQIDKIADLQEKKREAEKVGNNPQYIKRIEHQINTRVRVLNTIKRHLDPKLQRGQGYKFRIGGTSFDRFYGGAFFEETREIKEFSEASKSPKSIPAYKHELIDRFIERIEDLGLIYPEDTGGLKSGSGTGILESSQNIRIYPFLEIPITAYTPCKKGERIRLEDGEWKNRCISHIIIKRAFDPYNIGGEGKKGHPKKGRIYGTDSVIDVFTDTAVVIKNAITLNQNISRTGSELMDAISGQKPIQELKALLQNTLPPSKLSVRLPDGTIATDDFYERRKMYKQQNKQWIYDDKGDYKLLQDNFYSPLCQENATADLCSRASQQVEKQSKGRYTCNMRNNKCDLAYPRLLPAGIPSEVKNVWGLTTTLGTQMDRCKAQLQRP